MERVEGIGVLNFLALDDLAASQEGEPVDPESIIKLPAKGGRVSFPDFERRPEDPFLRKVEASGKKWAILTDPVGEPQWVLDADAFLRAALFETGSLNPYAYCHRPVMIRDERRPLAHCIGRRLRNPSCNAAQQASQDIGTGDNALLIAPHQNYVLIDDVVRAVMRVHFELMNDFSANEDRRTLGAPDSADKEAGRPFLCGSRSSTAPPPGPISASSPVFTVH